MESLPKAHHFVPQVYLKYFSPDGINIFRSSNDANEEKFLPIKSVAKIKDYYTYFKSFGIKDTYTENPFFRDFEGLYPGLIERFSRQLPVANEHDYLICILAIMHARVPKQRNHVASLVVDLHKKIKSLGSPDKNLELRLMIELMKLYANVISHSYFWVAVVQDDSLFITSDNPAGNACLPLTNKMCVLSSGEKKPFDYYPVDKEFVDKINRRTFENADRYIFSTNSLLKTI